MAKFFESGKGKKRITGGLALLLSATLSLGVFAACTPTDEKEPEESETPSATDVQRLKNGNFEFFSEMDKDADDKRAFINSPNDWSFSSGSPSSTTSSGIVTEADWGSMTASTHSLILDKDRYEKNDDGTVKKDDDGNDVKATSGELTAEAAKNASDHWDDASVYDRLEFYDFYSVDSADDFELYGDYRYSIDFEDVQYLADEKEGVKVDSDHPFLHKDVEEDEDGILMIHNRHTSDGVRGTAQYYTSSTTITLSAGTAASVSVWVRTSALYHYAASTDGKEDIPVEKRAGAYIGVTNTVGGTTLDQMQIKNIVTHDAWEQYTVYIRANSYASTTFRIVLGLGQGSSDSRYESVDGYAFFDDVVCNILSEEKYDDATKSFSSLQQCDLNSKGDEKLFLASELSYKSFALDLNATKGFKSLTFGSDSELCLTVEPTKEVSGSKTYYPENIDPSLKDTRGDTGNTDKNNIGKIMTLSEIENTNNGYLRTIYNDDFKDKFPFDDNAKGQIVMLLSTNGTAYTAKSGEFTLGAGDRKLITFYVKTSKIVSGLTGASAILVDGENRTTITAFDTTSVAPVNIESDNEEETIKDLHKGWVRCFFFVENASEEPKTFSLEFTYGPTAIASTTKTDYGDGYAAFTDFQVCDLTKTQYSYATAGTYAQKVTLTTTVKDSSKFDDAAANGTQLEDGLAIPVKYTGALAGSNVLVESQYDENEKLTNPNPRSEDLAKDYGIYTGLLSSEYAKNYLELDVSEEVTYNKEKELTYFPNKWLNVLNPKGLTDADEWWKSLFGNDDTTADPAYQPLVIANAGSAAAPAYGFLASSATFSTNSANRVSVRVKLSVGAKATVYLTDVSDVDDYKSLAPTLPKYTYWYDEDGNIVNMDPEDKDYKTNGKILFTYDEEYGLYKNAQDTSDTKYYANLASFERDDANNYVTTNGTIAFRHNPADEDPNTAYAFYDKDSQKYDRLVYQLPATDTRYSYDSEEGCKTYAAAITVTGTAANAGRWITLSFYVQTGNASKNYRLELWAGSREGTKDNLDEGIPAGGYVFFDRCSTTTVSNYATLRDATAQKLRDKINETAETKLGEKDNLPATYDNKPLARYYAFTFFDSPDYLRYDKSADEDKLGNPWGSYVQADHKEALMWLLCDDSEGSILGIDPSVSLYMSYGENEVTVTPDELGDTDDDDTTTDTDTDDTATDGQNIWLYAASILLVVALLFTIVAIAARKLWKKYRPRAKSAKEKKPKLTVVEPETAPEAPKPEKKAAKAEEKSDEDDPYNE